MMERIALPEASAEMLVIGESMAATLAEQRSRLAMRRNVEALLRASISGATHALNTYLAVVEGSVCPAAPLDRAAALEVRRYRNARKWRRRITRSIARVCRYLSDDELARIAKFVVAVSS